jgi:hypothetical protein
MPLHQLNRASGDGNVSASGLSCGVAAFRLGNWSFAGGSITLPSNGVWFVGVEFWSGQLRVLPRLGHRGWIPVARVLAMGGAIASVERIEPQMPECRIPRTMSKILAGQPINVVFMGSSLVAGYTTTNWTGMLALGATDRYKIPTVVNGSNIALGGAPNAYGAAQTGRALRFRNGGFDSAGFHRGVSDTPFPPSGRSALLGAADIVFVEVLANGGDYRMSWIEPLVRNLRKMGVEVVLISANPQMAVAGTADLATLSTSGLYVDGPAVLEVADRYGVEYADTAAYVVEAQVRSGGVGIYGDTIHMAGGNPAGPTSLLPANGHEAWARAVRSVLHVAVDVTPPVVTTRALDWSTGLDGAAKHQISDLTVSGGYLVVTKNSATSNQWGARMPFIAGGRAGDTVRVQGEVINPFGGGVQVGLQGGSGGGWAGGPQGAPVSPGGTFDLTMPLNRDAVSDLTVLLFSGNDSAALGSEVRWRNIVITVTNAAGAVARNATPGRQTAVDFLPPSRVVTDFKTPGDAWVILPKDEYNIVAGGANRGALAAHPQGAASFARVFAPSVTGASEDLLVLTAGQVAAMGAYGAVGFGAVVYAVTGETATVEVYVGNTLVKTVNWSSAVTRETLSWFWSPTERAVADFTPAPREVRLSVTAGTLRIAALVLATSEIDVVPPEGIDFIGAGWAPGLVSGGTPAMLGRETDTLGDFARLRCPANGRRVLWITSSKPNSKPINTWGGGSFSSGTANTGVNHINVRGGHIGPGVDHYIQCAETLAGGGDSTNGYALHVGGAIVVYDR